MRRSKRAMLAAVCAVFAMVFSSAAMLSSAASPSAAAADGGVCGQSVREPPALPQGRVQRLVCQPRLQFVYNCNRFELTVNLSGSSDFKVADANWSADADFGGGAAGGHVQPGDPVAAGAAGLQPHLRVRRRPDRWFWTSRSRARHRR